MGLIKIYLNLVDQKSRAVSDLFSQKQLWMKYWMASILYGLVSVGVVLSGIIVGGGVYAMSQQSVVAAGLGILAIAGVIGAVIIVWTTIALLRYQFFGFLIVDRQLSGRDALKESWRMTQGRTGKLVLLGLGVVGLNSLGFLCLGLGLVVTVPASNLAIARVYRQLTTN